MLTRQIRTFAPVFAPGFRVLAESISATNEQPGVQAWSHNFKGLASHSPLASPNGFILYATDFPPLPRMDLRSNPYSTAITTRPLDTTVREQLKLAPKKKNIGKTRNPKSESLTIPKVVGKASEEAPKVVALAEKTPTLAAEIPVSVPTEPKREPLNPQAKELLQAKFALLTRSSDDLNQKLLAFEELLNVPEYTKEYIDFLEKKYNQIQTLYEKIDGMIISEELPKQLVEKHKTNMIKFTNLTEKFKIIAKKTSDLRELSILLYLQSQEILNLGKSFESNSYLTLFPAKEKTMQDFQENIDALIAQVEPPQTLKELYKVNQSAYRDFNLKYLIQQQAYNLDTLEDMIKLKTPQKIKKHSICHQRYTYPPWFAGTLSLPPGYDQFDAYSRFVVFPQKYNAWIQRLSHHLFSQAR